MTVMKWMSCIVPILEFVGRAQGQAIVQIQVQPQVVGRSIRDGQVTTVFLAPRYVTAIRMPEPINSVVVGDPSSFSAEHSDREPNLVFVKPITPKAAQTNLLISSTRGLQTSLLLVSHGELKEEGQPAVDFLMRYKPAGQFLIQPADSPSAAIPQTVTVGSTVRVPFGAALPGPVAPASLTNYGVSKEQPATQLRVATYGPAMSSEWRQRSARAQSAFIWCIGRWRSCNADAPPPSLNRRISRRAPEREIVVVRDLPSSGDGFGSHLDPLGVGGEGV